MTRPVISVPEGTNFGEIVDILKVWNIKRVLVVRAGKPVGIVSCRDVVRL
jgi:CBS domain-containing protein